MTCVKVASLVGCFWTNRTAPGRILTEFKLSKTNNSYFLSNKIHFATGCCTDTTRRVILGKIYERIAGGISCGKLGG
jgi:hypothetical protein